MMAGLNFGKLVPLIVWLGKTLANSSESSNRCLALNTKLQAFIYHHMLHKNAARHVAVVRGYHVYENVWSAPIDGTELPVEKERT